MSEQTQKVDGAGYASLLRVLTQSAMKSGVSAGEIIMTLECEKLDMFWFAKEQTKPSIIHPHLPSRLQ